MTDVYAIAQALGRIADTLEEISRKLDYMIEKQTDYRWAR